MTKGIRLHVWGDYALFTRPEMKAERVSYDVMTPSAARAIVSSIYWKPEIEWVIDRIVVLNPIRFTSVRRNEVASTVAEPKKKAMQGQKVERLGIVIEDDRQQRASLILTNVAYVIEAHFNVLSRTVEKDKGEVALEECEAKHISVFNRRASAGQCFRQPYFGCREFPVSFRLLAPEEPLPDSKLDVKEKDKDFGFMLHDFVYCEYKKDKKDKNKPVIESHEGKLLMPEAKFFRAEMHDGVIDIPALDSKEVRQ